MKVTAFSANKFLQKKCLKTEKYVKILLPDIDVYFSAHRTGLDLEPAGVAGDVPVPALHDGGQGDPRTDRTLQVLLQVVREHDGSQVLL